MKHVVNITGMAIVAYAFCALAVLGETLVLNDMVTGIPLELASLDEWMEDFTEIGVTNVSLGAVMMLQYFCFEHTGGDDLKADAKNFALNTHAALKYYYPQRRLITFRSVYALGEREESLMSQRFNWTTARSCSTPVRPARPSSARCT